MGSRASAPQILQTSGWILRGWVNIGEPGFGVDGGALCGFYQVVEAGGAFTSSV